MTGSTSERRPESPASGPATPTGADPIRSAAQWARFLLGFAVLLAVLLGMSELDATGRFGLAILAVVLAVGLAVERLLYRNAPREALRLLGFGRPGGRALLAACVVGALVQLVYPLTAAITGATFTLRPDWPWLLIGIFAFHGLAEELVWRGYAYRRLRVGRSFSGRGAVDDAAGRGRPRADRDHLRPGGRRRGVDRRGGHLGAVGLPVRHRTATIWAPAVVHTAIDSFKLVVVPAAALTTFSLLLAAVSIVVPLLVLAIPRRILQPSQQP